MIILINIFTNYNADIIILTTHVFNPVYIVYAQPCRRAAAVCSATPHQSVSQIP